MTDILSDVLMHLSLKGTLYFRTSFRPPWGVRVPRYLNVARFHFAHRGDCLLRVADESGEGEGAASHRLISIKQGDLVIIPHGAAHSLFCLPETEPKSLPLEQVIERAGYQGKGVLVYDGGDPTLAARETQLICGHFSIAEGMSHPILERLPSVIHISDYGETAGKWMEASLRMIGAETVGGAMGSELIALKLSETIFAQAIRAFLSSVEAEPAGLAGFSEPQLARALTAFHAAPERSWSVADLAREAGMSRTAFAVRFSERIGLPPLQYLTNWRMQLACQALVASGSAVAEVAEGVGYASESGFMRVFKKEIGVSPAQYRRGARAENGGASAEVA